jgi:hypothetical protein
MVRNRHRPSAGRPSAAAPRSLLAKPDHDSGLGEHGRIEFLHPLQEPDRVEVARAGPHRQIFRRHGLEIVVEDVGPRRDDDFRARRACAGNPASGSRSWCRRAPCADRLDHLDEMLRAAIVEIVAVDRGDDDVVEPILATAPGDVARARPRSSARACRSHVAEGAGAGADVAHDHEGGVLLVPALADIRAAGLLAHRDQPVRLHDLAA